MATPTLLPSMSSEQDDAQVEFTHDHPQTQEPEEQIADLGLSEDDKNRLVKIITSYRTGWAPDRLLRMAIWMKSQLFYRGRQILEWDGDQNMWCDALALYRQSGKKLDGDDSHLEKWPNNITKMLCESFVGTMSRAVPPTVIRPENAEIPADMATAQGAQEAISIIERKNDIRALLKQQNTNLFLYGSYFKYTRIVTDGEWAGWDERPVLGTNTRQLPDRYHCSGCGMDVPGQPGQVRQCPDCAGELGPADFYPAEQGDEYQVQTGTEKVPRSMIKWDVYNPLQVDYDPEAKSIGDSPILALDLEVDIGWARRTFPKIADKIKEGAQVSTTPNASYERLRRNEAMSQGWAYTSDTYQQKPTYSRVWVQPDAYYRDSEDKPEDGVESFAQKMLRICPDGIMVAMLGPDVVSVSRAILRKDWSRCKLLEECGGFSPSIAEDVVPLNERLNSTMGLIDDFLEYAANGVTIFDAATIDEREIQGKTMQAGVMTPVRRKGGTERPLADSIWQFTPQINEHIFAWPMQLIGFAELYTGVMRQTFGGGTQSNVDTYRGQKLQVDKAEEKLNIFYDNEKSEGAQAAENAIWHLQQAYQQGLIKQLWDVTQARGSEFRNDYVDLGKMNGRIRVYPDLDQGLPQSPEQLRQVYTDIYKEAGEGNQAAMEMLDVVPNQEIIVPLLLGRDVKLPRWAQRARTLQHINMLMEKPWRIQVNQQTGQTVQVPSVQPEVGVEDWKTAKATLKYFRQENFDQQPDNPKGWAAVGAYYSLLEDGEMQEAIQTAQRQLKVTQAGQPQPDPTLQTEKQELLQHGAAAVERLAAIGTAPPMPAGLQVAPVVSANKAIADAALKVAE